MGQPGQDFPVSRRFTRESNHPHPLMARHKTYAASDIDQPGLDISSLIDVCFLLLIYFLVTSTILPRERDLGLDLAGIPNGQALKVIEPLYIRIEGGGEILTGRPGMLQMMDPDASVREVPLLAATLDLYATATRAADSTPLVQIDAADGAIQQRVIDVLNALAKAGIHSVTFTDSLANF